MDDLREVSFVVAATPIPQPRQRHGAVVRGDKTLSVNYLPSEHPIHSYKAAVRQMARLVMEAYEMTQLTPPLHMGCTFVLPRPAYLNTKRGDNEVRVPHDKTRPDIDNLMKAIMDACCGILYASDGGIQTQWAEKWFAAQGEEPHVIVYVKENPHPRRNKSVKKTRRALQQHSLGPEVPVGLTVVSEI